jgi:dTDP-4-dehydrorhamnose 3,5-epimerase-like enzyme
LAQGFQTLSDDTEIAYQISAFYARVVAGGYHYDDTEFGIPAASRHL